MIIIDNVLVSDLLVEEQFVCDLSKCKGACCEDGDAGAPLENKEKEYVKEFYEKVKPYMTKEGIQEVKEVGPYLYDREFGWVTPTVNGAICAYGYKEKGVIKCAFEQAYNDGKIPWKKPLSCHLFPIKIQKSKQAPLHLDKSHTNCSSTSKSLTKILSIIIIRKIYRIKISFFPSKCIQNMLYVF